MIGKLRQYFQERKLKRNFRFNPEFINGVDASEMGAEIYDALNQYVKRLHGKGVSKEDAQKMLDAVSKYAVRRFGKKFIDIDGETKKYQDYSFNWAMPLFRGLAEKSEHHDTLADLEKTIERFDFVAELHGII